MQEVIFFAERNEEGRYIASHSSERNISKEASTVRELKDAIISYYREVTNPILVRLYFRKDKYDITFYTKTSELSIHIF